MTEAIATVGQEKTTKDVEKEERERQEKVEKERREAWEKEPARGDYGLIKKVEVKSLSDSSTWIVEEHVYQGPGGPVAVPCTRGEQKAEYGDLIVRTLIPGATPEEDITIIDLVPHEVIPDEEAPVGLTNQAYQKFLDDKYKAIASRRAKPDNTLPTPPKPARPDQGLPGGSTPGRPSQLPAPNPAPKR